MIPCKNYTTNNGEPDCIFAPSTVGNSASSASEENQISASPLLQGIVICCWSTAAVNYNALTPLSSTHWYPRVTKQNLLPLLLHHVTKDMGRDRRRCTAPVWPSRSTTLGICRSSDDLARVSSTFTTHAFAAWPHAGLWVDWVFTFTLSQAQFCCLKTVHDVPQLSKMVLLAHKCCSKYTNGEKKCRRRKNGQESALRIASRHWP